MPWGEEQDKALAALVFALISPPILAIPDWYKPFQLHTDAIGLGAAALTQIREGSERVLGYATKSSVVLADAKRSPTERGVMAVLRAVDYFRPYMWDRRFTLITD